MTWRDNALALEALSVQGYYDEEESTLQQETLAAAIRDQFLRNPVRSSSEDALEKTIKFQNVGLSKIQLMDRIFPGFREKYELNEDELMLLKKEPKEHADLDERHRAVADLTNLVWGTMAKTGRQGAVQELLIQRKMLLIEAKLTRDGVNTALKVATDDHDMIIGFYVRPRGDNLVKVSGNLRDDCTTVGITFEGIGDRMKRELGGHVTTAITKLLQVATPDMSVLGTSAEPPKKAISSGTSKA